MQKTNHDQFTSFVLSEFEHITNSRKSGHKIYFLWVGCLLAPIFGLILGIINGGDLDRRITATIDSLFDDSSFFKSLGNLMQYSYFVFIGGALACLIIVILYLTPKSKGKVESASRYAILYLLVMSFSFIDHLILQILVNRPAYDPVLSSIRPFYQLDPSFTGVWTSSFPNNNLILSGVIVLLPILFGNRSPVFKWIIGVISGTLVIAIGFTEIGLGQAWFTDVFASIGLVLFWSWILYWHILFVKDSEDTDRSHKLTGLYYQAYRKLEESKSALDAGDAEECKKKLSKAKELYNQSISSIQNIPGNISKHLSRNEFWKFNINLLMKELENENPPSRKWLYIF